MNSKWEMQRTDDEIDKLMKKAYERIDSGNTYRGLSYEEGIKDAVMWLTDRDDESPLAEVGG